MAAILQRTFLESIDRKLCIFYSNFTDIYTVCVSVGGVGVGVGVQLTMNSTCLDNDKPLLDPVMAKITDICSSLDLEWLPFSEMLYIW